MSTSTDATASTAQTPAPSSKGLPWFPFFADDFTADEELANLSMMERGQYITLLCYDWEHDGLPTDERQLCRILGGNIRGFRKSFEKLSAKFPQTSGRLRHPRLAEERAKLAALRVKKSDAARARWAVAQSSAPMHVHCHRHNTSTTPTPAPEKPLSSSPEELLEELLRPPATSLETLPGYWEQIAKECAELDEYFPEYFMYVSEFKEWKDNGGFGPFTRRPPPKPEFLKSWR